jgi:hypothetical protein
VLDAHTFIVGCSGWSKGKPGVYRTTDGGATFMQVSDKAAAGEPLRTKDGTIYWPIIWDNGLIRSTDQGQTFTPIVGGGVLKQHTPIELPDGRLVAIGKTTMVLSADKGQTWKPISSKLPFDPRHYTYSARRKAFFITHNNWSTCQSAAVVRYDWDYATQ